MLEVSFAGRRTARAGSVMLASSCDVARRLVSWESVAKSSFFFRLVHSRVGPADTYWWGLYRLGACRLDTDNL